MNLLIGLVFCFTWPIWIPIVGLVVFIKWAIEELPAAVLAIVEVVEEFGAEIRKAVWK